MKLEVRFAAAIALLLLCAGAGAAPTYPVFGSGSVTAGHVTMGGTVPAGASAGPLVDSTIVATDIATLSGAQTFLGTKTFTNSGWKILGSSTGATTFTSDNSGASNFTLHLPAANKTLMATDFSNVSGTLGVANGGTGITSFGTGVATALGVNVGSAGAFVVNGGALGTPSSGTLTSATGLPISTGVSGLGSGVATFLGTPSSANLATAITDETGSGALVFGTAPTLTGATMAGNLAMGGNAITGGGAITVTGLVVTGSSIPANGVYLPSANTLGLAANSAQAMTLGTTGTYAAWTTNGIGIIQPALTFTDSSSSGTVASVYVNLYGAATLAASSSTTYTNAYGNVFNPPTAGTNVTITNRFAAIFNGQVSLGNSAVTGGNSITANNANGYTISGSAASSTVPTLVPNRSGSTTGIGAQAAGNISEIVAGTEVGRWTSTGLNNAAIGATTASTGAFTNLSASGATITLGNAGFANCSALSTVSNAVTCASAVTQVIANGWTEADGSGCGVTCVMSSVTTKMTTTGNIVTIQIKGTLPGSVSANNIAIGGYGVTAPAGIDAPCAASINLNTGNGIAARILAGTAYISLFSAGPDSTIQYTYNALGASVVSVNCTFEKT